MITRSLRKSTKKERNMKRRKRSKISMKNNATRRRKKRMRTLTTILRRTIWRCFVNTNFWSYLTSIRLPKSNNCIRCQWRTRLSLISQTLLKSVLMARPDGGAGRKNSSIVSSYSSNKNRINSNSNRAPKYPLWRMLSTTSTFWNWKIARHFTC